MMATERAALGLARIPTGTAPCLIGYFNVEAANYEATSGADDDDWRHCAERANMTAGGRCLRHIAAANRLMTKAGDPDQRPGLVDETVGSSDHRRGLALFEAPRASVFGGDYQARAVQWQLKPARLPPQTSADWFRSAWSPFVAALAWGHWQARLSPSPPRPRTARPNRQAM